MSLVVESCIVEELCISLGGSEQLLIELVDKLEAWLKLQLHLPQDASRKRLEAIILNSKLNLERAKKKLDMFYTIRRLVPEIYSNRNPLGRAITAVHDGMDLVVLPKLTPEKHRTLIVRITDTDGSKYQLWDNIKYATMAYDILMPEDRCFGEIAVVDLSSVTLSHVMRLTPSFLKKCETVVEQAYAMRLKSIHLINASPLVNRLLAVLKSVVNQKYIDKVRVHSAGDLESLYEFLPKSILPKDYGGDQPTMSELSAMLRKTVEDGQDWFLEQENVLVDERLRSHPAAFDVDSLFGFSGSFRKLAVD